MDGDLSAETVRAIVQQQFPALAVERVEYLDEGWDNVVYEADGWLLRFPKRADVEPSLAVELALLPLLEARLPVAVPRFELRGEPSERFPRRFAGYRKLPGQTGDEIELADEQLLRLGGALGDFVTELHRFPVPLARELGVPKGSETRAPELLKARVAQRFHLVERAAPHLLERARRFLEASPPRVYEGQPRFLHADLTRAHVLVTGERISGVIDWADVSVGDPACDFAGFFHWGGEPMFRAGIERYPFADAGLAERARFVATCLGFYDIYYGLETGKPECVTIGLRALELTLIM